MTTGPQDPAAAGRDRFRAGHADREQAIDTLKNAFVDGRLTKDELDTRAGQALTARTYADLAALTADIPPGRRAADPDRAPAARPARKPAPARRRPLLRAAAKSGGCLVFAFAAVLAGSIGDPNGPVPNHYQFLAGLAWPAALAAVLTAVFIFLRGVDTSLEQRHARRQLPPGPRTGDHALGGERRGGTGHGPVPPGPPADDVRADARAQTSRQRRQHVRARAGRAPGRASPAPGTI